MPRAPAPERAIFFGCQLSLSLLLLLEHIEQVILTGTDVKHGIRFQCGGGQAWNLPLEQPDTKYLEKIITDQSVEVKIPGLPTEYKNIAGFMNGSSMVDPIAVYWITSSLGHYEVCYEPTPIRNRKSKARRIKHLPDIQEIIAVDATPPTEVQYSPEGTPTSSEDGSPDVFRFDLPSDEATASDYDEDLSCIQVRLQLVGQVDSPGSEIELYDCPSDGSTDEIATARSGNPFPPFTLTQMVSSLSEPEGFISQSIPPLPVEMSMILGSERGNTLIEESHDVYSSKRKNMLDEARQYLFPVDNWFTIEEPQTVEDILEAPQVNYNLFRGDARSRLSMSHGERLPSRAYAEPTHNGRIEQSQLETSGDYTAVRSSNELFQGLKYIYVYKGDNHFLPDTLSEMRVFFVALLLFSLAVAIPLSYGQSQGIATCSTCKFIFEEIQKVVGKNSTEAAFQKEVVKACAIKQTTVQKVCTKVMAFGVHELFNLIEKQDASAICHKITLCK
ncbi:hypothetical protein PROFUN_14374 [Planoprotostelium fungivorum]|uniref:Saposin B-type domain-containing protein n=1 Tax=Planoprotostelium fungivorum TaxID=1890364 RepID=A0A2P6N0F6_9EUKA|nr:hypothetical protein PROFUN_14374 [Planoprotostelium fungivorum]